MGVEKKVKKLFFILSFIFPQSSVWATSINPLNDGGWELVSHMSNNGGMFDGNGELMPNYSFGTFEALPTATTPDFARIFPFQANKILFITGDLSIWGITDYNLLRNLVDAHGNNFNPNLSFEIGINGVISNTVGNVLSRSANSEDPWISIDGGHSDGINNQRIAWGESDYFAGPHQALKNNHAGLNVYIRSPSTVPVPTTVWLFGSGIIGLLGMRRKSLKGSDKYSPADYRV
jgi:hypothetical protein